MPRTIIIPDVQQLTDHYITLQRQQRWKYCWIGGNIAGFRGTRMQRGYGIGGKFRSLARFAMPLFKKSAESVGKRASIAVTEVGKDVLDRKKFKESTKSRGREGFTDLANQGANALLHQTVRGKKRRIREHSNLSCIKRRKLLYDPADQKSRKWITEDESSYESDSETSQQSDDSFLKKFYFVKRFLRNKCIF